jgi:hypothetical protein
VKLSFQTKEIDFHACQSLPIAIPLLDIHATGLPSELARL